MTRYRINPGEFRHPIIFQRVTDSQDEYGAPINEWQNIINARAAIYPINGKDFFMAEQTNNELTHKIHIRFMPGITPDMRIKFGERYFEISSPPINFQEKNTMLQLLCKELV